MQEKINKMLEMQKALDKAIYTEHNTQFDEQKCKMAIIDEIGELTHELKGDWCWWKKTQAPVDRTKVLGELVDIWHFVLSYHYQKYDDREYDKNFQAWIEENIGHDYIKLSTHLASMPILEELIVLTECLGFTIDDVYNAYIEKNKVNYERLESGY